MTIEKEEMWSFTQEKVQRALSLKSKDYLSCLEATACFAFASVVWEQEIRSCLSDNAGSGQRLQLPRCRVPRLCRQPAAGRTADPTAHCAPKEICLYCFIPGFHFPLVPSALISIIFKATCSGIILGFFLNVYRFHWNRLI